MRSSRLQASTIVLLAWLVSSSSSGIWSQDKPVKPDNAGQNQDAASQNEADADDRPQPDKPEQPKKDQADKKQDDVSPPALPVPPGLKRLVADQDLWIDFKRKLVVIDGEVCLREGQLEMFACPKGSKEHESIVTVNVKPQFVHAALLAVGAKAGGPVRFDPAYAPASGTVIDIFVLWQDEKGKRHKVKAQDWIKHLKTNKSMPYDWVFAGSGFWKDEQTGQRHYHADSGDFICVSNFSTAMLDLPVESSQAASGLLFAAFTERIPERKTPIRLVLVPRQKDRKHSAEPDAAKPGTAEPGTTETKPGVTPDSDDASAAS